MAKLAFRDGLEHVRRGRGRGSHTTHIQSGLVHNHFMVASLDKPPGEMFDLLSCLHEKITSSWGKSDGNTLSSVTRPNMKARVSRATVDGETIEIGMKSCQNGILLAVFDEIRCSGGKEMRSVAPVRT